MAFRKNKNYNKIVIRKNKNEASEISINILLINNNKIKNMFIGKFKGEKKTNFICENQLFRARTSSDILPRRLESLKRFFQDTPDFTSV